MRRSPGPRPSTPGSVVPWDEAVPALLGWFAREARDLPWRHSRDPYAIWVSEIMLQQTQVRTVIPYWQRWMAALPDPATLAAAPEDLVLRLWEGLGYYSRARNLQRAARVIVSLHGGHFPTDPQDIAALPGIGRYTTGAVASIAFDLPEPLLDGNVIRVLTRLSAMPGDPKQKPVSEHLWRLAREGVEAARRLGRPGAATPLARGPCSQMNQALMELGAVCCTPTRPRCDVCPLAPCCRARAGGDPARFPETAPRPAVTRRILATAVVDHRGRRLLRRRPEGTANGGLWEFPGIEIGPDTAPSPALARWLGIPEERFRFLTRLRHSITRFRYTQEVFAVSVARRPAGIGGETRWVTSTELQKLPLTAAHRRLANHLTQTPAAPATRPPE